MTTMQQLLVRAIETLEAAGVLDAALDARYLLLEAFDVSLALFLANRHKPLPEDQETAEKCLRFEGLVGQRARRIPLQHLTGIQEFMGLEFFVNEHVLVPRQDTETLVELVLEEQKDTDKPVLDMCTGSGCIAISLARLGGYRQVTALDISEKALEVARRNAAKLLPEQNAGVPLTGADVKFRLLQSDMFQALGTEERFGIIVSNPPYIPTAVIEGLEPEVRDFEPRLALDGTADGLKFYRILAAGCGKHLMPGGSVYMEIGSDQGAAVTGLFGAAGFAEIKIIKDMAGLDRVVRAVWK